MIVPRNFRITTCLLCIFLLIHGGTAQPVFSISGTTKEYQVKAGFLVNFMRFITWPEDAFPSREAELVLCIAGKSPFGSSLEGIQRKRVGLRSIRVIYIDSLTDIPSCHLLYVSQSEAQHLDNLSSGIGERSIVSVSDIKGFVSSGGAIELLTQNNKLSFIINYTSMKQYHITVRASLLNLAASVL